MPTTYTNPSKSTTTYTSPSKSGLVSARTVYDEATYDTDMYTYDAESNSYAPITYPVKNSTSYTNPSQS